MISVFPLPNSFGASQQRIQQRNIVFTHVLQDARIDWSGPAGARSKRSMLCELVERSHRIQLYSWSKTAPPAMRCTRWALDTTAKCFLVSEVRVQSGDVKGVYQPPEVGGRRAGMEPTSPLPPSSPTHFRVHSAIMAAAGASSTCFIASNPTLRLRPW